MTAVTGTLDANYAKSIVIHNINPKKEDPFAFRSLLGDYSGDLTLQSATTGTVETPVVVNSEETSNVLSDNSATSRVEIVSNGNI